MGYERDWGADPEREVIRYVRRQVKGDDRSGRCLLSLQLCESTSATLARSLFIHRIKKQSQKVL